MSGRSTPGPSQLPDPSPPSSSRVLDTAVPVVGMIRDVIGGVPVPGLELAIGGAAIILEMLLTMQNNKEDIRKLREGLDKLKRDIDEAGVNKSTDEQALRLAGTSDELEIIITRCDKLQKSHKIIRFFQAKNIATQIADVKQSIRDTLQVFQTFSIISIENNVGLFNKNAENAGRENILKTLKRVPARSDAVHTPSGCMKGTRVQLLEDLLSCVKSMKPDSQITLVHGIAGTGKSTVAKSIATHLHEEGLLAASFFFSRDYTARTELEDVFSTIAYQLAKHDAEYRVLLSDIVKEDTEIIHIEPEEQLDKLILIPLSQIPPSNRPWVILFDALDECSSDNGYELLRLLTSKLQQFPKHVQFFLTGRPEDNILSFFDERSTIPTACTLYDMSKSDASADIRQYLEHSLRVDKWPGRKGWTLKDKDLDALEARSDGLFIFAATAVRYIRGGGPHRKSQVSVDFILAGTSGNTQLEHLYLKILDNAIPAGDPAFFEKYQRVLGAVIYLQVPLSITAIASLLHISPEDVSDIVDLMSSVLLVSGGGWCKRREGCAYRTSLLSRICHRSNIEGSQGLRGLQGPGEAEGPLQGPQGSFPQWPIPSH